MRTFGALKEDQNEVTEKVEVRVYEKTKERAEIGLSQEALIDFMEVFVKKLRERRQ